MDGIQPVAGPAGGPLGRAAAWHGPSLNVHPAKSPADYVRALRRRGWLVLLLSLAVGLAGAVWTMRRPSIYRVTAQILIEPPQFDAILTSIVSHEIARHDRETIEHYVPNRLALLRSKGLADRVFSDPSLARSGGDGSDPAQDLVAQLQTRQIPGTNFFDIFLEGPDPARTAHVLNTLLTLFRDDAKFENLKLLNASRSHAEQSMRARQAELVDLDKSVERIVKGSPIFAPGGNNLLQEQYATMVSVLFQKKLKHDDLLQQARIAELWPNARGKAPPSPVDAEIAELIRVKKRYTQHASYLRRIVRNFDSDPACVYVTRKLAMIMDELKELQAVPKETEPDLSAMAIASSSDEIDQLDKEVKGLLARLQESMPKYEQYVTMLGQREQLVQRIGAMQARLSNFDMLATANAQKDMIQIVLPASEPTVPVRPNRPLLIVLFSLGGLLFGGGLVAGLEYLDHSVKVPEHLSVGLTLPLFGIIPRIKRTAELHRGGHLWTPGAPGSLEADAYRNLRASLLGAAGARGPIGTLLVTSAKPGEGKSTTALNLAATCARAGERTLLMDVDLRRPSLADVFDDGGHRFGLIEVLRGDLPWQRAVARTDIPNLDFLPTGDTFDVPIEILGTIELRQLLIALTRHYDRVILDGPAVLGMADCRMLGRIVDSALLVVRCGAHDLRPLRRAKTMLEQSQVNLAGVVFNGLSEDLKNWSSYDSYGAYGTDTRDAAAPRGLPAPAPESTATAGAAV